MPRLLDRVVVITGAASGIGAATARACAREGARVVVTDVDKRGVAIAEAITKEGGDALFCELDVADEGAWERALTAATSRFGRVDVLVNNAGIATTAPLTEMTLEFWRSVTSINLDGVFLGTKHAVIAMRKTGGGVIVNLSSAMGLIGASRASAYCASKGGVRLFTKAVALECAADNIRVNSIHPGGVDTPIWNKQPWWPEFAEKVGGDDAARQAMVQTTPLKRMASPDEIAQAIIFLASDASAFMTGSELVIDGGFTAG